MKPVTQSRTGKDGNCFSACLASILEIPLAKVPEFGGDDVWLQNVQRFLGAKGMYYVQVPALAEETLATAFAAGYVFHTIEGVSPRGGLHACVGRNGRLIWDPHPQDGTGRGLVSVECYGLLCRSLNQKEGSQ